MAVRFIVEVAWQAHFVTNMFIRPTAEELADFTPDFIVYNASKAKLTNYKELGLNSETAVVFNLTSREQVIINTWYGGEMKKGMFSMMQPPSKLNTPLSSQPCSSSPISRRLGSVERVVLPVPERPKKIAVFSPLRSVLAEQCIEAMPFRGRK